MNFTVMTCDIRVVGARCDAERLTRDAFAALTPFDPESELSRLNADPREAVPVSPLLRDAVRAGVWAARRTGGLAVPGIGPWRRIRVRGECVLRPPGMKLDLNGTAKGLIADRMHADATDCAGDIRTRVPIAVDVIRPFTEEPVARVTVHGGVATSGIDRRGHHVLDPRTGEPADAGLVGATAFAPSALEAEALAKAALLDGRRWLTYGGFLFHEDGEVERV